MDKDRNHGIPRDLGTSSDRAMFSPSPAREDDESDGAQGNDQAGTSKGGPVSRDEPAEGHGTGQDAGRTQGGGSGGHSPSQDIQDQTDIRNNPKELND
jgi:hypothetical protein